MVLLPFRMRRVYPKVNFELYQRLSHVDLRYLGWLPLPTEERSLHRIAYCPCSYRPLSSTPRQEFKGNFRYLQIYRKVLFVLASDDRNFTTEVADVLDNFRVCMNPLDITHELPNERTLRFLDLELFILPHHLY